MNKLIPIAMLSAFPFMSAIAADKPDERVLQSQQVIKEFAGQLKGELKAAMKSGGPNKAIEVCQVRAPVIADELSKKYGWEIGRTSLKVRNPANQPDQWEMAVLKKFEQRQQAGESVKQMAYFEEVEHNGKPAFRLMKAIPMGQPCAQCHGSNISPEITAKLQAAYPDDKAVGSKLGEVRGAFTIIQPLQ